MKNLVALPVLLLLAGCSAKPENVAAPEAGTTTQTVSYPAGKDTVQGVLFHPAGRGPFPAVVVVHGDFGLNEGVKEQAKRLADQGYVTLAVDLYRGEAVTGLMDAHIMDRGLPEERALADLKGA